MIRTRASTLSTSSDVRSWIAARRFGRLDGFAYQSPPPSYWRRAIVIRAVGAERGALGVECRALRVERGANPLSRTATSTIPPMRGAPGATLHAPRCTLHALRMLLLF